MRFIEAGCWYPKIEMYQRLQLWVRSLPPDQQIRALAGLRRENLRAIIVAGVIRVKMPSRDGESVCYQIPQPETLLDDLQRTIEQV